MKSKLTILFILLTGLIFGQSVPNTNTFTLDSVVAVVGGNSLTDCFSRAVAANFDAAYVGNKDRLSNFRNYTIPNPTYPEGKYIIATVNGGDIFHSNDYGTTWTPNGFTQNFYGCSINITGQYQAAVVYGGYIYESNDWGATFTTTATSRNWNNISMDSTGQYQTVVVQNGYIYHSSDYGSTWTEVTSVTNCWSIAVSRDGKYQVVGTNGFGVYLSSDYGSTWGLINGAAVWWKAVAITTGAGIILAGSDNGMVRTIDKGTTWTTPVTNYGIQSVSISDVGIAFAGLVSDSWLYGYNNGASWNYESSFPLGLFVSISKDGNNIVASSINNYLYKLNSYHNNLVVIYNLQMNWSGIAVN